MSIWTLLKPPPTSRPRAMPAAALILLPATVALFGIVRGGDEGTAAHLFQLLIGLQPPVVAFVAITCLPEGPAPALQVLA